MRGRKKKPSADEKHDFYEDVFVQDERHLLEKAGEVNGVDDEIALLRIRLRELIRESPERIDVQMKLADTIARLVKTRYQISSEQKKSLKAAVTKVLEEVAVPLGIGIGVGVGGSLAD